MRKRIQIRNQLKQNFNSENGKVKRNPMFWTMTQHKTVHAKNHGNKKRKKEQNKRLKKKGFWKHKVFQKWLKPDMWPKEGKKLNSIKMEYMRQCQTESMSVQWKRSTKVEIVRGGWLKLLLKHSRTQIKSEQKPELHVCGVYWYISTGRGIQLVASERQKKEIAEKQMKRELWATEGLNRDKNEQREWANTSQQFWQAHLSSCQRHSSGRDGPSLSAAVGGGPLNVMKVC